MKKQIAILASGGKERTEEIIRRFNDGERVTIAMVLTDRENSEVRDLEGKFDTEILFFDRADWHDSEKIAKLLHDRRIELIVTDDFRPVLPDGLREAFAHRIVDLGDSSAAEAPGVIMKHLMLEKSDPDRAWAQALGIKYEQPEVSAAAPDGISGQSVTPPPYTGSVQPPVYQSDTQDPGTSQPMPPTYLIWSIVCTLLCCFIPGLFAIFFSSQVSSKYYAGDIEGAEKASRRAEIWIIISFVLGVISATLYLPLMLVRNAF